MEKRKKYVCGHFGRSLNSTVIEPKLIHRHRGLPVEGASINDICKFVRFFDPLPPYPHLDLIYSIKFTQHPFLQLLFHDPPPPSNADIISESSLCTPTYLTSDLLGDFCSYIMFTLLKKWLAMHQFQNVSPS